MTFAMGRDFDRRRQLGDDGPRVGVSTEVGNESGFVVSPFGIAINQATPPGQRDRRNHPPSGWPRRKNASQATQTPTDFVAGEASIRRGQPDGGGLRQSPSLVAKHSPPLNGEPHRSSPRFANAKPSGSVRNPRAGRSLSNALFALRGVADFVITVGGVAFCRQPVRSLECSP